MKMKNFGWGLGRVHGAPLSQCQSNTQWTLNPSRCIKPLNKIWLQLPTETCYYGNRCEWVLTVLDVTRAVHVPMSTGLLPVSTSVSTPVHTIHTSLEPLQSTLYIHMAKYFKSNELERWGRKLGISIGTSNEILTDLGHNLWKSDVHSHSHFVFSTWPKLFQC